GKPLIVAVPAGDTLIGQRKPRIAIQRSVTPGFVEIGLLESQREGWKGCAVPHPAGQPGDRARVDPGAEPRPDGDVASQVERDRFRELLAEGLCPSRRLLVRMLSATRETDRPVAARGGLPAVEAEKPPGRKTFDAREEGAGPDHEPEGHQIVQGA